jgi:predicted phage-related endonuclease
MSTLESRIREYREYKRMIEEMEALKEAIADEIKAAMTEAGESKMIVGEYKLSYTDCKRTDIDKKALAADHADIYTQYLRETTYKRFSVA